MIPHLRSFNSTATVLAETLATMLEQHPEAFDCVIYPAMDSSWDEVVAVNEPEATMLDRDERRQEYAPPRPGRAMIAPNQAQDFAATDSGLYESFNSAAEAINLLVSGDALRLHSFIQWREALDLAGEECVERTVYVAEVKPMGTGLHSGNVYVCRPVPALGEVPTEKPWPTRPEPFDVLVDNGTPERQPEPLEPPEAGVL